MGYNARVTMRPKKAAPSDRARRAQTLGLVIIALIIILSLLVRFGRHATWSWR